MKKINNLNEQILRMKSLMSEERLYGNLVKEEVVITEQTKGVKKAYSKMLRLVGDIMGAERKALNNINKKITQGYDDAIEKMRLGDGDAALDIFKQNENYIMGGQNSDNIMDLFALQNARLPKDMQIDKDILPDMVKMYQSMQKMINTSLANGWTWKDATKRFQKTLNLTDEQAEAAITIVLHNKPKLRKRLAYSTDDSKLLKRKDYQTKPDLSNSKLIKTQINAWDRSKKGLQNSWEKISKALDDEFSMLKVNKILSDQKPGWLEKYKIFGQAAGKAIATYSIRLVGKIIMILFVRIRIPAVTTLLRSRPLLLKVAQVASIAPLLSHLYASWMAYKFYKANTQWDEESGKFTFIPTRKRTEGDKLDGSADVWVEQRDLFQTKVISEWVDHHPYTWILNATGVSVPFQSVASGIRKDAQERFAAIEQKMFNVSMCCPASKLKPTEGVTPVEAIKNKLWNEKYAITEEEACQKAGRPGFGCKFDHKPSCKEIYDYFNSGDVADDLVKEMNREKSMSKRGDNYLLRMIRLHFEEWGFTSKDDVTESSSVSAFKRWLSVIDEDMWCDIYYKNEQRIPLEDYETAIGKELEKAFEESNIQEAYEAKAMIVQLGPVQMIYDEITEAMKDGKYKLNCDGWKSAPFNVGNPTEENIAGFKEGLDLFGFGDLSDDIDGFATYYCKRMRDENDKLKAIKEVDCKRAIIGACNGTSFDEIYKEELEVIRTQKK